MDKTNTQQFFDFIFQSSLSLGYDTYDFLPRAEDKVPYPFVVVNETINQNEFHTKELTGQNVTTTVHVWATGKQRKELENMLFELEKKAGDFAFSNLNSFNRTILQDTTTDQNLWHGILSISQIFYKEY
jgi:hypothetical protein